ncbi:MAG: RNase adapter RapZ [Pseudomonadota bacterium]
MIDRTSHARIVIVTGASGAGRTTAINAFEDIGFETIDNMPLSLLEQAFEGPAALPPMAIGIDVRNREFSVDTVLNFLDRFEANAELEVETLFLACNPTVLVRRYSETRRRHPLSPQGAPAEGIDRERELLVPLRDRAEHLIDTSDMTPHQLKEELRLRFGGKRLSKLALSVESFSYKRGLPRGIDMAFDVRFLNNPHWKDELRSRDGRDPEVAEFVGTDSNFAPFFEKMSELVLSLLPAFKAEGKTHLSIGIGCTGGQHRSVAVAEKLSNRLAEQGWQVSTRHRELERRGKTTPRGMGKAE